MGQHREGHSVIGLLTVRGERKRSSEGTQILCMAQRGREIVPPAESAMRVNFRQMPTIAGSAGYCSARYWFEFIAELALYAAAAKLIARRARTSLKGGTRVFRKR